MKDACLSRHEFNRIMLVMVAAIDKEFPESQADAYFMLLNDMPAEALQSAVMRVLEESDQNFIPAVGMLRKRASEALHGTIPSWGAEWERVMKAIRRFGRDRGAEASEFLGEFTARIVRQIGWREICNSETIGVQMSLFRSLYEQAAETESNHRRLSVELRPQVRLPGRQPVGLPQETRKLTNQN